MSGITQNRKEYLKRYYEQNKHKWNRNRVGLHKHTPSVEGVEQLNLFDYVEQFNNVQHSGNIETVKPISSVKHMLNSVETPKSSVQHSTGPKVENVKQLNIVHHSHEVESCLTFPAQLERLSDQMADAVHQRTFKRLFPSAKKKIDFWIVGELLALVTLSLVIVGVTTQAVATVNASLWPLIALLEVVVMFFSLTLANHSGANFLARSAMLIICVGLVNFLVAKSTMAQGQVAIGESRNREDQAQLLKAEIQRERGSIAELEGRGRITAAGERIKRLDGLRGELRNLQQGEMARVDHMMIWLTVIIRVVLGLSVILINHQISHILVKRKFLRFIEV